MITPAPNVPGLLQWMVEEGFDEVDDLIALPLEELLADVPLLMKTIAAFASTKDANSLFHAAQERHVAFGEVQSVAQVAANPQHEFRQFFRTVDWDGSAVSIPGPVARFHGTPVAAAAPPASSSIEIDELLAGWAPRPPRAESNQTLGKPLEGLRVVDLSHVLAGPFCTRLLGDLGADIIKFQTAERATIVNDPNHPYFYVWNRSKRAVSLNMKDPRAVDVARRVIEQADVVIENFSAGVLARWGLSYETVAAWNPCGRLSHDVGVRP